MKTIKIKPVEIVGNCRANLTLDDEFQIEGMKLRAMAIRYQSQGQYSMAIQKMKAALEELKRVMA